MNPTTTTPATTMETVPTCECCGNETTEALTLYKADYGQGGQSDEMCCRACMEETARLEAEIADDHEDEEEESECDGCGKMALLRETGRLVALCEPCMVDWVKQWDEEEEE